MKNTKLARYTVFTRRGINHAEQKENQRTRTKVRNNK